MVTGQVIVIRVYRWRHRRVMAGVLETADGSMSMAFGNFSELRKAMSAVLVEEPPRKGNG